MNLITRLVFGILTVPFFLLGCDTKKSPDQNLTENLLCYSLAQCGGTSPGTRFGMIGDSWTDLLLGVPAIQTLRYHLENDYGYKITGATLGGQQLSVALNSGLHLQVIDEAGANIHYMLLSLGGNDLQFRPAEYVGRFEEERNLRFQEIEKNLRTMILTGNAHKLNRYRGAPLVWFIHGYDYPNPLNENSLSPTSCRSSLNTAGINDANLEEFTAGNLDAYNEFLKGLTTRIPELRYIDLRGTLGGPPYSTANNMFDCIHPTSLGFKLLTAKYATSLQFWTREER